MAYIYAKSSNIPDWLPGVERVAGSDAGSMMPGSKWSLLLHTTEGPTLQGAIAALRAKSAWSHFIYDPKTDHLVQCVSMNRAAKSLKSGGNFGRTNAARVIQVEIVGYAHEAPFWSAEINHRIGLMIRRIANQVPFDVSMPVQFYGDRSGFTVASKYARQRMSWTTWYRFNAICGHQHAPNNDHWDPGEIQVNQILSAARQGSVPAKPAPWVAPKFPGYTMRQGMKNKDVAVLKVLLTRAGYGNGLDTSTPAKAQAFGSGTKAAVIKIMKVYDAFNHLPPGTSDSGAVGGETWKWIAGMAKAKIDSEQ